MTVKTRGLTHLAIAVRDPERAFRFYEQVFGMVATFRGEGIIQAETPGGWDAIVFEEKPAEAGRAGGLAHFGFRLVDPGDIEAAADAVLAAGGAITDRGEFVPGEPYLFCTDPDGYTVEIWYEPPSAVAGAPAE